MNYKETDYFILSSSCYMTKGYNRSIIQDFNRNVSNIISNEYFELIEYINRKKIMDVIKEIEEDSLSYFKDFLNFMVDNEYALFVENEKFFPEKSQKIHDDIVILKDCIVEIDGATDLVKFKDQLEQLDQLNCENIQLWYKEEISEYQLLSTLKYANELNFLCIEICIQHSKKFNHEFYLNIINNHACISKIYLFNSDESFIYEHLSQHEGRHEMLMGQLIYLNHSLDAENCGIISYENLSFGDENQFKVNKNFNGCLYKKAVIDPKGNLKNCPHLPSIVSDSNLKNTILKSDFQKLWFIKKDEIEICKDCEFRYNCSDCRAFTTVKNDVFSKPKKCGYSPYTNEWA